MLTLPHLTRLGSPYLFFTLPRSSHFISSHLTNLTTLTSFPLPSPHFFCHTWRRGLSHIPHVDSPAPAYQVALRLLHKGVRLRYDDLSAMCHANQFDLAFLTSELRMASKQRPDSDSKLLSG